MGCKRAGASSGVWFIKAGKHLFRRAGADFSSSEYLHRGHGKSYEPHNRASTKNRLTDPRRWV
jgi:hypothetical protein